MNTIITIGRENGSGGHEIGTALSEALNIPYYDKELLDHAAQESGICKEIFESQDEKRTNSFLYSLVMDTYSFGYSSHMVNEMPLNQKVFLAQFNSIKAMAKEGPCIFVGRCADYALEEEDVSLLRVYINAPLEQRIKRVVKRYGLSEAKARDRIQKSDKQRASYYNYYTNKKWGATNSYDLCINSGIYGIDGCVALISEAVKIKENGDLGHQIF